MLKYNLASLLRRIFYSATPYSFHVTIVIFSIFCLECLQGCFYPEVSWYEDSHTDLEQNRWETYSIRLISSICRERGHVGLAAFPEISFSRIHSTPANTIWSSQRLSEHSPGWEWLFMSFTPCLAFNLAFIDTTWRTSGTPSFKCQRGIYRNCSVYWSLFDVFSGSILTSRLSLRYHLNEGTTSSH